MSRTFLTPSKERWQSAAREAKVRIARAKRITQQLAAEQEVIKATVARNATEQHFMELFGSTLGREMYDAEIKNSDLELNERTANQKKAKEERQSPEVQLGFIDQEEIDDSYELPLFALYNGIDLQMVNMDNLRITDKVKSNLLHFNNFVVSQIEDLHIINHSAVGRQRFVCVGLYCMYMELMEKLKTSSTIDVNIVTFIRFKETSMQKISDWYGVSNRQTITKQMATHLKFFISVLNRAPIYDEFKINIALCETIASSFRDYKPKVDTFINNSSELQIREVFALCMILSLKPLRFIQHVPKQILIIEPDILAKRQLLYKQIRIDIQLLEDDGVYFEVLDLVQKYDKKLTIEHLQENPVLIETLLQFIDAPSSDLRDDDINKLNINTVIHSLLNSCSALITNQQKGIFDAQMGEYYKVTDVDKRFKLIVQLCPMMQKAIDARMKTDSLENFIKHPNISDFKTNSSELYKIQQDIALLNSQKLETESLKKQISEINRVLQTKPDAVTRRNFSRSKSSA